MASDPFEGYLSLKEAAKATDKKAQTLRDMARRGELTRYYFGRSLYFKTEELRPKAARKPKRRT